MMALISQMAVSLIYDCSFTAGSMKSTLVCQRDQVEQVKVSVSVSLQSLFSRFYCDGNQAILSSRSEVFKPNYPHFVNGYFFDA
jgi:hypothetical protein